MKVKVKDALRLVDTVGDNIKNCQKFILGNVLVPYDAPQEEIDKCTGLLSSVLGKMEQLYNEKYSLQKAVHASLTSVGVNVNEGEDISYADLYLDLERAGSKLEFLNQLMSVVSKDTLSFGDKASYIAVVPTVNILNDILNVTNIEGGLAKQVDDVKGIAEIDIELPKKDDAPESTEEEASGSDPDQEETTEPSTEEEDTSTVDEPAEEESE